MLVLAVDVTVYYDVCWTNREDIKTLSRSRMMEPKTRFPISRESCLSRNNRLLPVTVTDKLSCWHGKNANAAQPAAPIRQQVGGTNRAAILHRLYIMVTLADQLVVFKLTVLLLNTRAKILREHRVSN